MIERKLLDGLFIAAHSDTLNAKKVQLRVEELGHRCRQDR
jgi:hypothetical protein